MTADPLELAAQYGRDVLTGKIITGKLTKLAVKRHDKDLTEGPNRGLFFCEDSARRALTLFSFLKHSKGEWAGQQLELEPWQAWIIACVFGWKNQETDKRRYRTVYEEIARKNGKTTKLAGIGLYGLTKDDEGGPEIYCLEKNTLVLTCNFEWVKLNDLNLGDELIAFDENTKRKTFRKLRTSIVSNLDTVILPAYKIILHDGREIIASSEHKWLGQSGVNNKRPLWMETKDLKIGALIRDLGKPWVTDKSWEAGYLAGIYDGEGCFHNSQENGISSGWRIQFSQNPGVVYDYVRNICIDKGFKVNTTIFQKSGCCTFSISGFYETFRFLGEIRPLRLLKKSKKWLEGKAPTRHCSKAFVKSIEFLGEKELIAIGTSTETLFANGLFSHNSAATKRDQSRILFDESTRMIKQSRPLHRRLDVQQHRIVNPANFGKFEPLSADGQTMDGLNPHMALVDELHAHKTAAVWDVLKSALGARSQPLIWAITTAGFNKDGICYEVRDYAIKVLQGIIDDDSFFSVIYTLDDGDDWADEDNWIKANPNLNVSVSLDYLREQARQAVVMPTAKINFFTKHLNIWVTGATAWCNIEFWNACYGDYLPDEILDPVEVYLGLDLASVSDIASIGGVAIMPDGRWLTFGKHYLPEDAVDNNIRKSTVPFRLWHEQGWLTLTPGNVIDFNWIKADILTYMERFNVKEIAFDRWNSSQLVNDLMELNAPMVAFGMGYASMNAPMKELERRYLAKEILHPNDPVLNWAMSNVVADQDAAGNIKPAKNKSSEKIDPAVALIMAVGRAMIMQQYIGNLDDFLNDPIML